MHNGNMEIPVSYLPHVLIPFVVPAVRGAICCAVFAVFYLYFKKWKHLNISHDKIPRIKMPFSNLYGIFWAMPSFSTMEKLSLPPTAFITQIASAIAFLAPYEKIIATSLAFQPVIILNKAESIEEFLCSDVLAAKPFQEMLVPFFGSGLFTSAGRKWKARKKVLTPIFRSDILDKFLPVMDREAKVLVDVLGSRDKEIWKDIFRPVANCATDIVCETFLGISLGAQKGTDSEFVKAMSRATNAIAQRLTNPLYHLEFIFALSSVSRQLKRDTNYLQEFCMQAIQRIRRSREVRKAETTENENKNYDSVGSFLHYLEKVTLGDRDVRDELLSFIFAGADTTASAMAWALYLIGLYPEIQNKIHEELDTIFGDNPDRSVTAEDLKEMRYLDCVLKESQRLYPSVPFNMRQVLEDTAICGYKVKSGTSVIISVYTLHRNPDVFPNPEVFDPDRFLPENCSRRSTYAFIPFSAGIRSCIGRRYAEMEVKTVVANVLRSFSLKARDPRDKAHASMDIILRPVRDLMVKFSPRQKICSQKKR